MEEKVCPACGAGNRADAEWCTRCFTRFEPPATVEEPEEPYRGRNWTRLVAAVLIVALAVSLGAATLFNALRQEPAITQRGLEDAAGFRFLNIDPRNGEPARYDPCRELHFVLNPDDAPAGAGQDVRVAAELAAQGLGVNIVFDGTTDEPARIRRPSYQPERYGDRWAPILIGWIPHDSRIFDEHSVGVAGSELREGPSGDLVYVTGAMVLNATEHLDNGFGAGKTWGKVLLHEWGHLLGLDHVENPTQVMNPNLVSSPAVWGTGDLAGLRQLGPLAGCVDAPRPG
ncbi:MAG: matrixin family metalloprotease [Actinomycetota bacterium]